MASVLALHLDFRDSIAVIRLGGRLSAGDLIRLSEAVRQAEERKPKAIHLELAELEYIDSAGLGFLTAQHKHFLDSGVEFRLRNAVPSVQRIFRLTNLDKVLLLEEVADDPARQIQSQREALWESFNYSQFILMALGEGLLGLDLEGRVMFANPTAERLLGWSEAQLYRRHMSELIAAPSSLTEWQGELLFTQPRRQAWVALKHADGGSFEAVVVSVIVQRKSERVGMLVGINDRTELEHTRAALRSTQRQFALIASSTSDGLIMYDLTERASFTNKAMQIISGYPLDKLQAMKWSDLGAPDARAEWETVWQQSHASRPVHDRHLKLRTRGGVDRWCLVSAVPVMDEQGQRMGLLFTLRDIDESRKLAERVHFLERMEAISRLAGGLAGDLLAICDRETGQLADLTSMLEERHPGRQLLAEIGQQHEYLHGLIDQLLTSSRQVAGKSEAVSLVELVKAVLSSLRSRLARGIEVGHSWGDGATIVLANREELHAAIFHLCLNALEAMGQIGRLHFKTERVEIPQEERGPLRLRPAGPFIRLDVADSGAGMTPEVLERAFDPFFTTKSESVGSGLGLTIVYGTVRQFGGWVNLHSQPGAGTTVELFLPIAAPEAAEPAAKAAAEPALAGAGGECLFVIDDEPLVLNFATAYLQHLGYRTVKAAAGIEAIALYKEKHAGIDLILMDLSLPDLPGALLLKELRAIRPDLKVVVSSGMDMETLAELAREPGVRGTLQKPYRGEKLGSAIREALDKG